MTETISPGLYRDMPNAVYHATDAFGSSGFKLLEQSPLHYYAAYKAPNRTPDKKTQAKRRGTAWHCNVFEPEAFSERYVILPEGLDRRTKEGKALWAEVEASGKEPIKPDENDKFFAMGNSARAHPISKLIFSQKTIAEASIFALEPDFEIMCKIRPDLMIEPCAAFPNGLIVDGKSTGDASAEGFGKFVWNWSSFYQAAFYSDIFALHYETKGPPEFVWLAQEADAPYATAYYSAGPDLIQFGRKRYIKMLLKYLKCLDSGIWPGYDPSINDVSMPVWANKVIDETIAD